MATKARAARSNARKSAGIADDAPTRPRDAEVLQSAAQIFARRGYAAATVQDVADDLGILKGSIYYYIKTKEDLLFRLLDAVHDDVDALLEHVRQADDLDPLERLCAYVRTQTDYNLRNLVRISVYYNDVDQLSDERRKHILRRRKTHEDFVTALVLDAQRQRLIDPTRDARLLTYSVFATIIWPYRWFKPRGRMKIEDVVDSCVAFAKGGLTAH
jgi:AcrR family transcriptional regulator